MRAPPQIPHTQYTVTASTTIRQKTYHEEWSPEIPGHHHHQQQFDHTLPMTPTTIHSMMRCEIPREHVRLTQQLGLFIVPVKFRFHKIHTTPLFSLLFLVPYNSLPHTLYNIFKYAYDAHSRPGVCCLCCIIKLIRIETRLQVVHCTYWGFGLHGAFLGLYYYLMVCCDYFSVWGPQYHFVNLKTCTLSWYQW